MSGTFPEQPDTSRNLPAPSGAMPPGPWVDLASRTPPDEEQPLDVRRVLAALLRRKWMIILVTLAGTVVGFALSRMRLDPDPA